VSLLPFQGTPSGIVVSAFCDGEGDAHSSAVQPVMTAIGRQPPLAGKPRAHPARASIVTGGRQPKIAELHHQIVQIACRSDRGSQRANWPGRSVSRGTSRYILPMCR
jgi:hypothetical protein